MRIMLEGSKYQVVQNAISEEMLSIANLYYHMKFFMGEQGKDYTLQVGSVVTDNHDIVQPFSIHSYSDYFTESLLIHLLPTVREVTNIPTLEPSYSFVRFYENGQWLGKHSDRPSCQYSITLPLMAFDDTPWTIFMEGNSIDLKLGDMVVYKGCEAEHWREPFEGKYQVQAHLHYVDASLPAYAPFVNDGRPSLGMKK